MLHLRHLVVHHYYQLVVILNLLLSVLSPVLDIVLTRDRILGKGMKLCSIQFFSMVLKMVS